MKTVNLICIGCPLGCPLTVEMEGNEVKSVAGNTCPRGAAYAKAELLHPTRTLTTTVRLANREGLLAVKTNRPISKERLLEAMDALRSVQAVAPVHIGDVILQDLLGEADLVACAEVE